MTGGESQCR